MNTNPTPERDPLDRVLRQWVVDTSLPARFQEEVWQRIARAETRAEPDLPAGLWRLIQDILPRPKFAVAYLSVVLALGVTAGALAAQAKTSRLDSDLSLRYVQSVDPYRAGISNP